MRAWSPGTACQEWSNSGLSVGVFQHPGGHPKPSLLKRGHIFTACEGAALSRWIRARDHTTSAFSWYHWRVLLPLRGGWIVSGQDVLGLQPEPPAECPGAPRGRSCSRRAHPAGCWAGRRRGSLSTIKQHHLQAPPRPVLLSRRCSGGMCTKGVLTSAWGTQRQRLARPALPASSGRTGAPGCAGTEWRTSHLPE